MRVDIEHVRKIQAERMKINKLNFDDIEWYEDGKKVKVSSKVCEDFKFTGLNNIDFITAEIYKETSL